MLKLLRESIKKYLDKKFMSFSLDKPKPKRTLLFAKAENETVTDQRLTTIAPTSVDNETISVLSYNIWFDEVCTRARMKAIAELILSNATDVVLLQEVTTSLSDILFPMIARDYEVVCALGHNRRYGEVILQKVSGAHQKWHAVMHSKSNEMVLRVPFENSCQGRCLQVIEFQNKLSSTTAQQRVLLATSHLESLSNNWPVRLSQLQMSWSLLQQSGLPFIFGGDMNMAAADDRALVAPASIGDAWVETGSNREHQHTWDTSVNKNLDANYTACARFDRFYCDKLRVQPLTFVTIGKEPLSHHELDHPLFPSDHWGILSTFKIRNAEGIPS